MIQLFAALDESEFNVPKGVVDDTSFSTILQIVFGVAGAVCVLVIMIGALKYVSSNGDPAAVASAKNTIIYAVIGLAIAAAAFGIVTFVVNNV